MHGRKHNWFVDFACSNNAAYNCPLKILNSPSLSLNTGLRHTIDQHRSYKIASLKKEADGTLAALEFLIAWGERLAFALVKFSDIIMKEIC